MIRNWNIRNVRKGKGRGQYISDLERKTVARWLAGNIEGLNHDDDDRETEFVAFERGNGNIRIIGENKAQITLRYTAKMNVFLFT